MMAICSGFSAPVGGICGPALLPAIRAIQQARPLLPGRMIPGCRAAAHRVAAAVEPEPVHLLRGAVAAVALLPQDRLHVARRSRRVASDLFEPRETSARLIRAAFPDRWA